jgi:hypothetical protein
MAAETSLRSRYLPALKHAEHQHAGPEGKFLTPTDNVLAFKNEIQVWKKKKQISSVNIECSRFYFRFRIRL